VNPLLKGLREPTPEEKAERAKKRPKRTPADDECIAMLETMWLLLRKTKGQESDKQKIFVFWTAMIGEKFSLHYSKRALAELINTCEWWPAPVSFHAAYTEAERNGC
jgi:hypothetical protein